MSTGTQLLKEHQYQHMWQRYCGYLDLNLEGFMGIQRHLLLEQMDLLRGCELGQHIMGGATPTTVDAFRKEVPLTTYADYAPFLSEHREEALPARTRVWQRTSGASGEHEFKWAPLTERMYEEMGTVVFAMLILTTCRRRGDINFGEGENLLYALAPPPYATGCWGRRAAEELPINVLPSVDEAESLPFEERLALGMRLGLDRGIDLIFGLPSVLVALGEQVSQRSQEQSLRPLLAHPRSLLRVLKAVAKSKLARRSLLPRDLWSLRGVAIVGSDASLYRERLKELWGCTPLDIYGCTEGLVIAVQTWDRQGMTFLPYLNFLEFIPEEERMLSKIYPGYQPSTVLLDELQVGQNYEVVITNFLGGPFTRYQLGDMVTITSQRNEALGIDLPQMSFYSRCDSLIDLAGFTRLTEKTLWQALETAGVPCRDWTAQKEGRDRPVLHFYLELRDGERRSPRELGTAIHEQLKRLDTPYAQMETFLGLRPVQVTLLQPGSFGQYMARQRANGADLAHLKPAHVNPSTKVVAALLLEAAEVGTPVGAATG
jgi:hypothetical protein